MSRLSNKQRASRRRNNVVRRMDWAVRDQRTEVLNRWQELLEAQDEAPDYPYEWMSYIGTYTASYARSVFWHKAKERYGPEVVEAARAQRHGRRAPG